MHRRTVLILEHEDPHEGSGARADAWYTTERKEEAYL